MAMIACKRFKDGKGNPSEITTALKKRCSEKPIKGMSKGSRMSCALCGKLVLNNIYEPSQIQESEEDND